MQKPLHAYLSEFFGTLLLVLIGCGAAVISGAQIGILGVSLAFGIALMGLVYIFGPASGCHVNPAVTIGLFLSGKFDREHVLPYIAFQMLGAAAGAYILSHIAMGKTGFVLDQHFALNGFDHLSPAGYSMMGVGIAETVLTAVLILAVLATTTKGVPSGFGAILVGLVLAVLHLVAIPISNASLNVARSFGPALIAMDKIALHQLLYFAGFHILGAVLAVTIHKMVNGNKA